MRIKPKRLPYIKQALRICGIILIVPVIAWLIEFAYNNYIAPYRQDPTAQYMILSGHGYEGYDYAPLNSLLRKVRSLENSWRTVSEADKPIFKHRLERALVGLEAENKSFITYYYSILDMYTQANMPIKLRRRLHYYRTIIRHSIGSLEQISADMGFSPAQD